jgi:hypothetical protein
VGAEHQLGVYRPGGFHESGNWVAGKEGDEEEKCEGEEFHLDVDWQSL